MLLRGTLSQDWVSVLPNIVEQFNNSPNDKLGGLTPNSIHSEFDSVLVNEARKKNNINVYSEVNYHQQILNKNKYESDSSLLQVNSYVYVTSNEKIFDKSYNTQAKITLE